MPAREGFLTADIAVLALHHRRIRKLRNDLGETEAAVLTIIWLELVLASWAEGDRLEVGEIDSPAELTDERTDRLRAAGLIDASGRIPAKTWTEWFAKASDRRAELRAYGRKGAAARWSGKAEPKAADNGAASGSAIGSATGSASGAAYAHRPSVRPLKDGTDETVPVPRTQAREPARVDDAPPRFIRPTPTPRDIYCEAFDEHAAAGAHQRIAERWRCMTCEKARAASDPLTFREKVDRASRPTDLELDDERPF